MVWGVRLEISFSARCDFVCFLNYVDYFHTPVLAKTEKFYDLAGSLTYIGITSFIYIATYGLTFSPSFY